MASENQSVKSKRDTVRERVKASRPEVNLDDDESVYGAIADDYDHFDQENKRLQEENEGYAKDRQAMSDFLMSGRNNGEYLEGMLNGEDMFAVASRIHGKQALLDYLTSDEAEEKYKQANEEFEKRKEQEAALKKECDDNLKHTDEKLAQAVQDGLFTEEEATEAIKGLFDMADALKVNACEPEWIVMWLKAKNYDSDVTSARENGYNDGVNDGVDKQMKERKSSRSRSIDMPMATGGSANKTEARSGGSLASKLMG